MSSVSKLSGGNIWKYSTSFIRHELWTRMWIFDCDISPSANCGWTDDRSDTANIKRLDAVQQYSIQYINNHYTWYTTTKQHSQHTLNTTQLQHNNLQHTCICAVTYYNMLSQLFKVLSHNIQQNWLSDISHAHITATQQTDTSVMLTFTGLIFEPH